MKKILLSLGTIAIVGALVAGATGAFFNDTEVSANNVFTAGAIDLKVDQRLASYNGEECPTCNLKVVSDETNLLTTGGNAVVLSFVHPSWTADLDGGHVAGVNDGSNDGSKWIWASQGPTTPSIDQSITFEKTFSWSGIVSTANLYIATDNNYVTVVLNGNTVASTLDDNNFTTSTEDTYAVPAGYFVNGTNILSITVRNAGGSSNPQTNPAGLLYKLLVTGQCSQGQYGTPGGFCEIWSEKDLDDEKFFNFGDVKPGDYGRNLISFHVDNNDSWLCLLADNVDNDENVIVDPEATAGDVTDPPGELGSNIDLYSWNDTNNNGVYDSTETLIRHSFFDVFFDLPINDSSTGNGSFPGGQTEYFGLAWCAGTWNGVNPTAATSNPVCDGTTMGNTVQTDKLTADLVAYTEQWRNNPNFLCSSVVLP
ncbi:MAG: hypothetical protein A2928_02150 [Candidatus Taylorbacteria bacterium RIFCSPLOWO2_01_FULL_45_15b]|uniref:SipW-cognate class signal peptide n=1 Tax=Candidatus Taylorbacteria bacterium RIFCSPLOWO2_01_FULL_45_15b TaxID=1802319 RepID=A0A1G2N932_9BACT|nr:MAG: hypothetical protein A2928_02150 [Candidatus Taylorbacteria bacterium RIFCSPLOWO2_01_FULL_45_15b]